MCMENLIKLARAGLQTESVNDSTLISERAGWGKVMGVGFGQGTSQTFNPCWGPGLRGPGNVTKAKLSGEGLDV